MIAMPTPPGGAGALRVTVPAESCPALTWLGLKVSEVSVTLIELKLAVTFFAADMVTEQKLPITLSHPIQPLNVKAGAGIAVSPTRVPSTYE